MDSLHQHPQGDPDGSGSKLNVKGAESHMQNTKDLCVPPADQQLHGTPKWNAKKDAAP